MQFSFDFITKELSKADKDKLIEMIDIKMNLQSKLKNTLTLLLSIKERNKKDKRVVDKNLTNNGVLRFHRILGKSLGLDNIESDSCLSMVNANINSTKTWQKKNIEELESKHIKITEYIKEQEQKLKDKSKKLKSKELTQDEFNNKKNKIKIIIKRKKHGLVKIENKIAKLQGQVFNGVNYGKKYQKKINNLKKDIKKLKEFQQQSKKINLIIDKKLIKIEKLKEERKNKRLEYFISGNISNGNNKIRIIKNKSNQFDLYFNLFQKNHQIY
jgi:hypothetical protein